MDARKHFDDPEVFRRVILEDIPWPPPRTLTNSSNIGEVCDKLLLGAVGLHNPRVKMKYPRITVNPQQMGGVPCIRGLGIPVAIMVGMLAEGMTKEEILQAFLDLELADIREALQYDTDNHIP